MPKISADVSEARSISPLKPGEYVVECGDAVPTTASTGNPVLKLEPLTILSGPDQGEDEDGKALPSAKGRSLPPKYLPLAGKGAGILVSALEAFDIAFTKRGDKVSFDYDEFKGKTVMAHIGQRQYQGDTYPEIKRFKKVKD